MDRSKTRPCAWFPAAEAVRYADGGSAGSVTNPEEPGISGTGTQQPENKEQQPKQETEKEPIKAFTQEQLQQAREEAVEEYKRHLEEAQDYEKMTAEEKVAYLERQRAEEKLERYAAEKLIDAGLPTDFTRYVKAADEKAIESGIQQLKAVFDKNVQAGVEARFRRDGYEPRGTGFGKTGASMPRPRGVSLE